MKGAGQEPYPCVWRPGLCQERKTCLLRKPEQVKSYLATAFALPACQKGYKVYAKHPELWNALKLQAKGNNPGKNSRKSKGWICLVLDDFGIQPFDSQGR